MIGRWLDGATQGWVRLTGRRVDLGEDAWLQGPVGDVTRIGAQWLEREADRVGARVDREDVEAPTGLLPSMAVLDGPRFAASSLVPAVRAFYETTSAWRLDAWIGWSAWAWPFGWALGALFARRLEQLALPMRPLDVAHGMTSTVTRLVRADEQVAALWLRRLRATDAVVFSGLYSSVTLPSAPSAVRVAFPLPNGRLIVLLTPTVTPAGGLLLTSPAGLWGEPGAYLVVDRPGGCWSRRIPIHEEFHVHVDDEGVLRTDHRLDLGRLPVLRLHYRLTER